MNASRSNPLKAAVARALFAPIGVAAHVVRSVTTRVRLSVLHQRSAVFDWVAGPARPGGRPPRRPRVLTVVTHVTPPAASLDEAAAGAYAERLRQTLDALFRSTAHCDVRVVVNTHAGRHLLDRLPAAVRGRVEVLEHADGDPRFAGFRAQPVFFDAVDAADWFLFLEDDMLIHDACFLDKIDAFNRAAADPRLVLLPHRYEMSGTVKTYIERDTGDFGPNQHSERTAIRSGEVTFVEFENAHAALYCLTREQVRLWARSPRHWHGRVSWVSPLDSAATGCLMELFTLYKPHPDHVRFLEVQHWGEKYAAVVRALDGDVAVAPR